MKPRHVIALLSAFAATAASADSYTIDPRHTFPSFEVSHYGFSLQRGRFNKLSGTLELDATAKKGSVEITIDTTSVDMGFEDWNKHMRGERFFQTDKFPQARFVARDFAFDPDTPGLETTIKRSDFGMNTNLPGIGDDVGISIPVEALKDS
jgi:polyisoprenoid-binding protein YceI